MALKLQQPGVQPLGQFDGYDGQYLGLKGGELVRFDQISNDPAFDLAASDVFDGYVSNATTLRTVVKLYDSEDGYMGMLADEGTSGYGTLFGVVVGGVSGRVASGGTVLGPHTATGSGKVTCWDKPGLYAVTLDATEVSPTDAGLYVGAPLVARIDNAASTQGQLQRDGAGAGLYTTAVFGAFVAFETNGSLVTTPKSLVSPLDAAKSVMVFQFDPWGH